MSRNPKADSPIPQERIEKEQFHDRRTSHIFRRVLHVAEQLLACIALLSLFVSLGLEIFRMATDGVAYFSDVEHMLHSLLTFVVGLEFVRMLVDTTPANILEVLAVAITRHVILSHDDPLSNVACIACIAGLFAIRRYLIPKGELQEEMVEEK